MCYAGDDKYGGEQNDSFHSFIPPGKYEVKFAVRDNNSRDLGTISVPIHIE
jgi:hypothetical protein